MAQDRYLVSRRQGKGFEMTLVEAVATVLGPAIAKSILKKWLKDSVIASDFASSLIDLIKLKTSDHLTQTKTARQFEAIGERVAESLLTLFEAEGVNIPENGRTAVAIAVAETLNKAGIDAALLAEKNLEPRLFADYLLKANTRATRDFSEAEKALYERSIQETSQYIVDIAAQLPQFNERTFGELLRRQNQLQDIADQILEEVQRIRQDTKADSHASALFEVEYRRSVIRNLDELELFGVDASQASRRHKLSVAYVTLSVSHIGSKTPSDLEPPTTEVIEVQKETRKKSITKDDEPEGVPVDKTLEGSKRLLVLGEAGSGKTTLLQWIAVRAAQRDFAEGLAEWNDFTPFFIRLRQCVDSGLPSPEQFPRFVAPAILGAMPATWVHDRLRSGRAVVLVDGLDELGETQRKNVRTWLRDLAATYSEVRFVVSSRPYAVQQNWLKDLGFEEAELLPMELPDISSFVDHWHSAVRDELQLEVEREELIQLGANLKEIIRKSIQLRKLATNPLLCAMLCALHRDRQRKLPSDRIELYEACLRMLIERRDVERGVDLRDYPDIGYRQKRAMLQDFAYWLLKNGYSMVEIHTADDRFQQKLRVLENVAKGVTGEGIRRLFIQRSGILREPVKDQVDFTHRTFQEFLGAQAALDDGDLGLLINNANLQEWREVVVLAAGVARPTEREEIIRQLIARGDKESRSRHQLHLLAVACLETSIELSSDLKKEVSKRLEKLIPPTTLTEAKALASAGELALPFLSHKDRKANITAACIRTLSLIGGDASLSILEDYYPDRRGVVGVELIKAWDCFDRQDYAARVYSKSSQLVLTRPSSIEGLDAARGLKRLFILEAFKLKDLGPIGLLEDLTTLRCSELKGINSIPSLGRLTKLSSLYLSEARALDLNFLYELSSLNELTLSGFTNVLELSPLSILKSLTNLNLSLFYDVGKIDALGELTKLKSLRLTSLSKLIDITPLSKLEHLETLSLWNCLVSNITPLSKLKQLETLSLGNCEVNDLTPISNPTKLRRLELFGLAGLTDLGLLANLVQIEQLTLQSCKGVANLEPLTSLINLEKLDLSYCSRVHDLAPLAKLPNLKWLSIYGTPAAGREIPGALLRNMPPLKVFH